MRGPAGLDHLSASPILGGFMGEAGMGVHNRKKVSDENKRHSQVF